MPGSQEPNGVLEEMAGIPLVAKVNYPQKRKEIVDNLKRSEAVAMRYGITTAQEGRAMSNHKDMLMYAKEYGFKIDVVSYLDVTLIDELKKIATLWPHQTYTDGYRVGGMKIVLDGSPQGRTAWRSTPYLLPPDGQKQGYKGYPVYADDNEVIRLVELAFKNDWQVMTHANGDAAIDQMIKAIKAAAKKCGNDDRRSTLIHGMFLQKRQYKDLKVLGIIPSMFTMHTFYWGDWYKKIIGPKEADRICPAKSLIDEGLTLTIHTDAPVALPNQMTIVDASVNRTSRSGDVIGKNQLISPYEAMKAITINAAYEIFEEDKKGSLKEGKVADLVILDANPLKIDTSKIKKIIVSETIKNGKTIYMRK
jgi:predicted amidohydrolase YtcJ